MTRKQRIDLIKSHLKCSYTMNNYLSIISLKDKTYIAMRDTIITLYKQSYGWSWWANGLMMSSYASTLEIICKELNAL